MERERNLNLEKQPQRVVRSIVVSLASADEIYNDYKEFLNSQKQTQPCILRFYLGMKGNEEEGFRYTFLGGKINPDEDFNEAIVREVGEEINVVGLGIPWQTVIGQWQYFSEKSGEREIILTYNPVLPNEGIRLGNGAMGVVTLTIDQLEELVKEGVLNGFPLEAHLSTSTQPKDKIEISEEDIKKRNYALEKGIGWMWHLENYLKKKFNLIIENNPISSIEEFEREYQKILSDFMRKGLEVGFKQKKTIEEQKDESKILIETLNSGFLGKDILYYLPYLAEYSLNWEGLNNATEGTKVFIGFLKDVFNNFLSENGLSEDEYRQKLTSNAVILQDKLTLIQILDGSFRNKLKTLFKLSDNDLDTALLYVQNFFRELLNDLRVADPQLTLGLYQDFKLVNEVNNANYGYLLSLFLGYDTKKNSKIIRFEAGRHLLLLFKTLIGLKYYQEQIKKLTNGLMPVAVNNFFWSIPNNVNNEEVNNEESIGVNLGNGQIIPIRFREKDGIKSIVDEKPTKTFTSFLRKSFEEKYEDIKDFYGVSIVDSLDPKDRKGLRIDYYNEIVNNFVKYLKKQYPDFDVEFSEIKTYGSIDFIEGNKKKVGGKREGSQSTKMVRGKTVISLKDKNGNEVENLELTIYPFFSLEGHEGFWGWLEKIKDDKDYVVRRVLAGGRNLPSLYDLLFPLSLYPYHYDHKLNAKYHN